MSIIRALFKVIAESNRVPNLSERGALRVTHAKGLDNRMHFDTKVGLEAYTVYRSLIGSCALHHLNPYDCLEDVPRPVRHWPAERIA